MIISREQERGRVHVIHFVYKLFGSEKKHLCFCLLMRPMSALDDEGAAVLGCGRKYTEVAVAVSFCFDFLSCFSVKRWGKRGLASAKTDVSLRSSFDTLQTTSFLFSAVRCPPRSCA
jgi:hypothetical protein